MEKINYGLIILILLISCNRKNANLYLDSEQSEKQIGIQDPNHFIGNNKAKAMVLGVFHFANPQADDYKPKFSVNILEEKRQKELDLLLEKIAKYKPTKILVEINRIKSDSIINRQYQNYLKGHFKIEDKVDETYQIGFKLAKNLNHKKIFCSDASAKWFGVDLDWDNYDSDAYLKSKGQYEKSYRYDYESYYILEDSLKTVQTLTEHLAMVNNPLNNLKDHQSYLTSTVLESAGDNYLGADSVARWYRRNLRIFANAYDLTDFDKEERLLLIYGSGHVWQLRQFFMDSPDFEYEEPNKYLKN